MIGSRLAGKSSTNVAEAQASAPLMLRPLVRSRRLSHVGQMAIAPQGSGGRSWSVPQSVQAIVMERGSRPPGDYNDSLGTSVPLRRCRSLRLAAESPRPVGYGAAAI